MTDFDLFGTPVVRRLGGKWTSSYGTDIRLKSPACKHWQIHKLSPFHTTTA